MKIFKVIRNYLWVRKLKKDSKNTSEIFDSFQKYTHDDMLDSSLTSLKHLKASLWIRFKNLFKKIISIGFKKS
ncbi:hypothetical protein [Silvanigrella sp.]|uniref:hypothetical protein n=1 Tax=Silvanigrella sp. TaxID=2024976 RepID=UPI0037C68467